MLIQKFVSDSVWGYFSNEKMAVIVFKPLTQHGREVERVAILTHHDRYAGTALWATHLQTLFQIPDLKFVAIPAQVQFCDGWTLSFDLAPSRLVRNRE